jgi:hypothetical protein
VRGRAGAGRSADDPGESHMLRCRRARAHGSSRSWASRVSYVAAEATAMGTSSLPQHDLSGHEVPQATPGGPACSSRAQHPVRHSVCGVHCACSTRSPRYRWSTRAFAVVRSWLSHQCSTVFRTGAETGRQLIAALCGVPSRLCQHAGSARCTSHRDLSVRYAAGSGGRLAPTNLYGAIRSSSPACASGVPRRDLRAHRG